MIKKVVVKKNKKIVKANTNNAMCQNGNPICVCLSRQIVLCPSLLLSAAYPKKEWKGGAKEIQKDLIGRQREELICSKKRAGG